MIGPTDLLHPSPKPHSKTFQVFLIYCPTTSLQVQKFYYLPTDYLEVLYVSQKITLKFFLYGTEWLVFITEETSVYCAV
jgi:hypothetical protein